MDRRPPDVMRNFTLRPVVGRMSARASAHDPAAHLEGLGESFFDLDFAVCLEHCSHDFTTPVSPLPEPPFVNRLDVEPPPVAHLKRWDFAGVREAVNRRWADVQVYGKFLNRHDCRWDMFACAHGY